ncbi:NAD-dependent histone deacetylase HST3 like protein [Verticillium longisporum]|uniref:NAD-dependent histone deacetylase HST3 like protein n=1 Tax=Verticillium longisporum TaxID=100787 RepID=A0A8I3AW99_VERLO|nr:NAD-dependent histone deacetylase HST3 like protein [Verticillium longisporum]
MPTIQVSPDADELLQSVANGILKSRKIIVVTGAGISTNSGIPDFRSENGLYALIQAQFDAANKDPTSPTALTRSNSSTSVGLTESQEDGPPTKRRKLEQTDDDVRQASPGAASSRTQDDPVECLRNGDHVKTEILHAEEPMPGQMTEDHEPAPADGAYVASSPSPSDEQHEGSIALTSLEAAPRCRVWALRNMECSTEKKGVFVDKPAKLERSWQHDLLRDGRDAAIIPSILGISNLESPRDVQPTASHLFISHLRDRGKLVRCYTQNIDQIEEKVGLSTSLQQGPGSRGRFSRKSAGGFSAPSSQGGEGEANESIVKRDAANGGVECVFLHGSLQSLRCFLCGRIYEWDEGGRSVETLSGRQPECPHCVGATVAREERGKRALGVGKLRPDIVLYGEEHPNAHLIDPLVKHDLALYPDSLLILGTSLKVHGLKVLVREFAKTVHSKGGKVIFVNFTKPSESSWGDIIDYWVQWDCDAWVSNLQERVPLLWLPPGTKLPVPGKKKRESSGETKAAKRRSSGDVGKPVETGGSIIPDRIDSLISDTTGTRVLFENAPAGHGKNSSFAQNLVAVVSIMFCVALGYHPVPNASAH